MKRTEPQLIGDILKEIVKGDNFENGLREARVVNSWRSVVGDNMADYTSRVTLREGRLYVIFSSAAARSECFMRRKQILEQLNKIAGANIVKYIAIS